MKSWSNNLQTRITKSANSKWGSLAMFFCAFADASFLPLPTSTFFMLLVALNTKKAMEYIFSGTLGIVTGALTAYIIGHFAWFAPNGEYTLLGQFVFNHMPGFSESSFNNLHSFYSKWDFWLLFGAALTPIPFGIFSVFAGVFDMNIFIFLFAAIISHGIKFSILVLVTIKLGAQIQKISLFNRRVAANIISFCMVIIVFISDAFKNLFHIN
jgi:membrane protein YqaA with SNARE-associated domain